MKADEGVYRKSQIKPKGQYQHLSYLSFPHSLSFSQVTPKKLLSDVKVKAGCKMHIPQGLTTKKSDPIKRSLWPSFGSPFHYRTGRILFLSHYSHRNSDCPYSINTFISQCGMDLITNLWQHELRTTKKLEVIIFHQFGVFIKHSLCTLSSLCMLSSLLCSPA